MPRTNGFDTNLALAALRTRIGWQQPTITKYDIVSSANLQSDSGRYWNDFHALNSIENLYDLQNDANITPTEFNTWLTGKTNSICAAALNAIDIKNKVIDEPRLLFQPNPRFYKLPITNQGKICGLRIVVAKGDFATQINSVALLFNAAATFNLYLYQDMQQAPLWSQVINATGAGQNIVELYAADGKSPLVLNDLTPNVSKGATFFLCYNQADLGATQAYSFNLTVNGFKACRAESFESALTNDPWLFDRYVYATRYQTYGINAEITTYRDYTNTIVQSAKSGVFDELLGLMMSAYCVEQAIFPRRNNTGQRQIDGPVALQLYTDLNSARATENQPFDVGLRSRIKSEIRKVNQSFQKRFAAIISGAE